MALTRPRASQIFNLDYKQATRVVTTTNVTLAGGTPAIVDGVTLVVNDRVLVTGQTTASQNGLYYVVTVGTGSNGTWARTADGNTNGEIEAGMIIMVTEGSIYADTQWKLITDNPITIGITALTFTQNYSANSISSGTSNVVVNSNSVVTISSAGTANVLTVGPNTITATANIIPTANAVYSLGNATNTWAELYLSGNSLYIGGGNLSAYSGNLYFNGNAVVTTINGNITTTGNVIAANIISNNTLIADGVVDFTNSSNVSLGNIANVKITGGQDGQIIVTDGTGNLQWVDNTPTTVTYIANSISQTGGVYVSGDLYSIQVFGDYNEPDGVYILTDGTGPAPAWIFSVGYANVVNFNQVQMNINYTAASNHTIYVQLYNYATSFTLPSNTVTTTAAGNLVTVSSTANMYVGQTLVFGANVGGLVAGTNYYILSVPNSTQVTLGIGTANSSLVTLSDASVTTTVDAQNYDNIGTYTGLGYYYAFALDVIDDTNYISNGAVDLRLFHSNAGNATHVTDIDYVALVLSNQGPQGPKGPTGPTGATGPGVPTGGTTGQVLIKANNTNYATTWSSSLTGITTISASGNITAGNVIATNVAIDRGAADTNWNNLVNMGTYSVDYTSWSGTTGTPVDSGVYVGLLSVLTSGATTTQTFYPGTVTANNAKIQWDRTLYSGTWTAWYKIINDFQVVDAGSY
jgi:hypothetical protein